MMSKKKYYNFQAFYPSLGPLLFGEVQVLPVDIGRVGGLSDFELVSVVFDFILFSIID